MERQLTNALHAPVNIKCSVPIGMLASPWKYDKRATFHWPLLRSFSKVPGLGEPWLKAATDPHVRLGPNESKGYLPEMSKGNHHLLAHWRQEGICRLCFENIL